MRFVLIALSTVILGGCNQTTGQQFAASAANEIRVGSEKAAVQRLLGDPQQRSALANGEETWIYDYSKVQSDQSQRMAASGALYMAGGLATSMIPGASLAFPAASLGMVAVNSKANVHADKQTLTVVFKKNIVASCKLQTFASTTEMSGVSMMGPTSTNTKTDSREINCQDIGKNSQSTT